MDLGERYRTYPPNGRLLVPESLGRGGAAAIATTMACRPSAVLLHHVAYFAVRVGGTATLGHAAQPIDDPRTLTVLEEVCESFAAQLGPIDCLAILTRRQTSRDGLLALAFRDREPVAFIKSAPHATAHGLDTERDCLAGLHRAKNAPLLIPSLLGSGDTAAMRWNAIAPLPPRPHRPAFRARVAQITTWLHTALEPALTDRRNASVPSHWLPMHGDFAPWNLRRILHGPMTLFDFEDARFAPPLADMTYWTATSIALRSSRTAVHLDPEARAFWMAVVTDRVRSGIDPVADRRLLAVLQDGGD